MEWGLEEAPLTIHEKEAQKETGLLLCEKQSSASHSYFQWALRLSVTGRYYSLILNQITNVS